jgi:hypothetical protein
MDFESSELSLFFFKYYFTFYEQRKKIGNKTFFLFGGENKRTGITCSNSVLWTLWNVWGEPDVTWFATSGLIMPSIESQQTHKKYFNYPQSEIR